MKLDKQVLRIDTNFAACESTYWASYACLSGFAAVYLGFRGLSNTQIGLTTSISCAMAMVLQLLISALLDKRPSLPIKLTIVTLGTIGLAAIALLNWLPMPIAMMTLAFATAHCMGQCNNGYLNAMLVQFNNVGIKAHYGWPRGMGSVCYAVASWCYGLLAEKYTPAILMPVYMVGVTVFMLLVLLMPNPYRSAHMSIPPREQHTASYKEMLLGNPTLLVFMVTLVLNGACNAACYGFIIRVIEGLGGGTAEYGISELIRASAEMPMLVISVVLLKRFRLKPLMAFSYFFYAVRCLTLAFAPSIGFVYVTSLLNMFSVGVYVFTTVLFVNRIVGPTEKVRGQSMTMLSNAIGSIIGNYFAGAMIDAVGIKVMLVCASAFSFVAMAALIFLCRPEKYGLHV